MPDEVMGEKVCVYIVPRDGQSVTLEDVATFMKESGIAVYKIPERIEIINAIPRNPVGKALKNVLRKDIRKKIAAS
jgi:non-ribosomal peptide synthetase component E (peptide arylation enzyme)